MALDREDTLKKAEKLVRQGRLDAAIAEYVRVLEDQPRDWNTAITLGDLYLRDSQSDKAVEQYSRVADDFLHDGFYPKAAALYRKILKITPDDEPTQLKLADVSAKLGLLADAKSYLATVGSRRRVRGDARGADEIVVRLGSIDPSDIDARIAAARVQAEMGEGEAASLRLRELYGDLMEKGREPEAIDVLRESVRLNRDDRQGRAILARAAVASGDVERARLYLDRDTAQGDPDLVLALAEIELRAGNMDEARQLLPALMAIDATWRDRVVALGWSLTEASAEAAFACIDVAVDASVAAADFEHAAASLQEFVARSPGQIPALLKLVEVCVDGGLEATMYDAQAELADAYLRLGQAEKARVIAEDLVAREPWQPGHIARFRQALVALRVSSPDEVIAERLSGQTPFTANDPFADVDSRSSAIPGPTAPDSVRRAQYVPVSSRAVVRPAADDVPASSGLAESAGPPEPALTDSTAAPVVTSPSAETTRPAEIDLTGVLGDLGPGAGAPTPATDSSGGSGDELGLDVSLQPGVDHAAQHMKIARTYLEMGMVDEAVASLTAAAAAPRERFEAASLLGRLFKSRGDIAHAIEWFERAAEAPAPSEDIGRALLYNLGATLEEAGEVTRALSVFLELQADAGDYRDVAARVDHLARTQPGH